MRPCSVDGHDEQGALPVREPAASEDPEPPIGVSQTWPWVPALKNQQLLPQA